MQQYLHIRAALCNCPEHSQIPFFFVTFSPNNNQSSLPCFDENPFETFSDNSDSGTKGISVETIMLE